MRKQPHDIHFEKISLEQWRKDAARPIFGKSWEELTDEDQDQLDLFWYNIKLPQRSSVGSAGYDFFLPYPIEFNIGYRLIPTGIRWYTSFPMVLLIVPRSGLGFKHGTYLANTIGVIDQDYYGSDNEGHIMAKMNAEDYFALDGGKAFMQGIMVPYFITEDDATEATRNGGFGSSGA